MRIDKPIIEKFRIHDGMSDDSIIIEGCSIEEVTQKAKEEIDKRGWKDCWSEDLTISGW